MSRKSEKSSSYFRAAVTALIFLALLLAAWYEAGAWYRNRLIAEARTRIYMELVPYGDAFISAIQRRAALLKGLSAFVSANPSRSYLDERFEPFIHQLYTGTPGIRYLTVAPGGVNAYVYPLEGNRELLGLDVIDHPDPTIRTNLQQALRTGRTVVTCPIELPDGQKGLLAGRTVLSGGQFWGVVTLAVETRALLAEAGIIGRAHDMHLSVIGRDGDVIYAEDTVLASDPVRDQIRVGGEIWTLAAIPKGGWDAALGREWRTFRINGLVLVGLLTLMIFFLLAYQERLRRSVVERTRDLRAELKEREIAQAALRKSEENYRTLYHTIRDAILVTDADRRIVHCNTAFTDLFGYSLEEVEGESTGIICANDEEFRRFGIAIENNRDRAGFITSIRFRKKSGEVFPAEVNLFYIRDESGRITGYIGMSRDVSKQAEAMSALRERDEQFRTLTELAPTAIAIISGSHPQRYLYVNSAWEELTGYSKKDAGSLTPADIVPPELREVIRKKADARLRGKPVESRYELQIITRDGRKRWLDFSAAVSNYLGERVIITVANDITSQKEAEDALRNSETMYRKLFEEAPIGIFRTSSQGRFLRVNPGMTRLVGAETPEQVISHYRDIGRQLYVDPQRRRNLLEVLTRREQIENYEVEMRRIDGMHAWLSLNARISEKLPDGSFLMDGFASDITGRRNAQQRVLHLNRILRSMREIDHLISREKDRESLIRQICTILVKNRGFLGAMIVLTDGGEKPLQYAEAGIGEAFDPIRAMFEKGDIPPCCAPKEDEEGLRLMQCESCTAGAVCTDNQIICRQMAHREKIYGYVVVSTPRGEGKDAEEEELFAETAADVAYALSNIEREQQTRQAEEARDRAEEQLLQAQKMEAIGRLAGGVAHDFNNMLNVILGYASIARSRLGREDPIYKYLLEIEQAAQRSAELTGQLLAFSRKQITEPRVININDIIEDHRSLLDRLIGEEIEVRFEPGENIWNIRVDPFQIDQILTNLAVNSRDAIQGLGDVSIRTENIRLAESEGPADLPPGDYVLLAFSDTGSGMDAFTLEQIFEPFFTTKEKGKGTGLGLSTVYGIVKQNNGAVQAFSEPGQGTTFKIWFPRHKADTEAISAGPSPALLHGSETVLVVEDEEQVLNLAEMILKDFGYSVLKARTPNEAVKMAREYDGEIDLLLTDVIMPEMNGVALRGRIREIVGHDVKTLFMSGYTDDVIAGQGVLGENFLVKPFTVESLTAKVREILDS